MDMPIIKYKLLKEKAYVPIKANYNESGYDVTLIDIVKKVNKVTLYGTGISVQPPQGWYFELVPRSSIIKSGYMMANSIGIIDQDYTGEIMVPLIKIDESLPDITLPNKIVQLIPKQWHAVEFIETSLEETKRGDGGFGSTDK